MVDIATYHAWIGAAPAIFAAVLKSKVAKTHQPCACRYAEQHTQHPDAASTLQEEDPPAALPVTTSSTLQYICCCLLLTVFLPPWLCFTQPLAMLLASSV